MSDIMTLQSAEELFDLPDPYSYDDVKSAYRNLIITKHPDVRKDVDQATANAEAAQINAANKILSQRCKDNPSAKFSRTTSHTSSYGNSWDRQGPSVKTTWQPTPQEPVSSDGDVSWEIPIEDVTWEDLVNDFWSVYQENKAAERMANGGYSAGDLRSDAVASAMAWAARHVARRMDAKAQQQSQWDSNMAERSTNNVPQATYAPQSPATPQSDKIDYDDYYRYEKKARRIKRLTGRAAVCIVCAILSWVILKGAVNPDFFGALFALMSVGALFLVAAINLVSGVLSKAIQKRLFRRLGEQFDNRYPPP